MTARTAAARLVPARGTGLTLGHTPAKGRGERDLDAIPSPHTFPPYGQTQKFKGISRQRWGGLKEMEGQAQASIRDVWKFSPWGAVCLLICSFTHLLTRVSPIY